MKYLKLLLLLIISSTVNGQTYATMPFSDDFEASGTQMGDNWTISSTYPQGKVDRRALTGAWPKFTVSSATKGTAYSSTVDPSGKGMAIYNTAITAGVNIISANLALNADNLGGVMTKFNIVDWGTGYSGVLDSLKIYISTNGGSSFGTFYTLVNLNQSPYNDGIWNTVNVDISGLATTNALVLSSTTIIKFVFNLKGKGDTTSPKSGNQFIYIDNFSVTTTGALPVELLNFNAELEKDNVYLSWTTASEIANEYFTIERQEGSEWVEVGRVSGAGYSNDVLTYNFIDEHITEGIYYYRLKQTDFDGQYSYSDIVLINYKPEYEFTVFPNPVLGTIYLTMPADMDVTIKITNIIGQTVYKELMSPDNNIITIDGLDLANGYYHIIADYSTTKFSTKLILKK
jgi:hypothetical protein